ncbi:hypothetical protein ACF13M_000590 [Clostridioides difficile]|nr:hypothetical protein [Clostridioides difficile]EKG0799243.1 hypothetical protein [Clostridioides difficile]EKS6830862.1 hypothetical protein [Clostridioides difficile]MBY2252345.1 hypothetical protein [Clostridioides difficile]MCI2384820.1 hypothetical protein [Clostridioides difficile]
MKLIKLPLKLIAYLLIAVVCVLMLIIKVLVNLSTYILGPFMLFLTGCCIFVIVKGFWNQLFILGTLLALCVLSLFCAAWILIFLESADDNLKGFVRN